MKPKSLVLALLIAVPALQLQGCMAVPVIAAANMIHKSGTAVYEVAGNEKAFPKAFRSAVQRAGGIVRQSDAEYGKAEFVNEKVAIEYQRLETGGFSVTAASADNVARTFDFSDSISVKAEAVINNLRDAGYTIKSGNRQRGI